MLKNLSTLKLECRTLEMKKYIVEKSTRIGIANFKTVTSIMSEQQVKMSFPTWNGSYDHKVGKFFYKIILISPEI